MGRITRVEYGPFDPMYDLPKLRETFSYTKAGLVKSKSLALKTGLTEYTAIFGTFGYDTLGEGRLKSVTYPRGWTVSSGTWTQDAELTYELAHDERGRPRGLTEKRTGYSDVAVASGVSYNINNQMTAATIFGVAWSWSFNFRGQLTNESAGTVMNLTYAYSATANDGRVEQRTDTVSGETVAYLYDKLGRLSSATATGSGGAWNQSYTYDGFGNMTQRSGSGTPMSVTVNSKNQITSGGATYDLNGNLQSINSHPLTYDFENRLVAVSNVQLNDPGNDYQGGYIGTGQEYYAYSTRGERLLVEHKSVSGGADIHYQELRLYDLSGQLLSVFEIRPNCVAPCTPTYYPVEKTDKRRVYFAGRLVKLGTKSAVTDRLGSLVALREESYPNATTRYRYYPYGEAIGDQTPGWDKPQFATYTRDSLSGLDDAMNRQFDRIWGRFTSPDPYQASGGPADPGSWNRYAYVRGNPTNRTDPSGLIDYAPNCTPDESGNLPSECSTPTGLSDGAEETADLEENEKMLVAEADPASVATQLAERVRAGYSDCRALADFIDAVARFYGESNRSSIASAFQVLVPASHPAFTIPGVSRLVGSSVHSIQFSPPQSGFKELFQNLPGEGAQQVYHFAAFFQLGYSVSGSGFGLMGGILGAVGFEIVESLFGSGKLSKGDVSLSVQAISMAHEFRRGAITARELSNRVRNTLCK